MIKKISAIALLTMALTGCTANMGPNETTGTWVGAVGGGAVGALFGSGGGHYVGAAVGAAAGALVGNAVGQAMDEDSI